jgi:hypothetical protein
MAVAAAVAVVAAAVIGSRGLPVAASPHLLAIGLWLAVLPAAELTTVMSASEALGAGRPYVGVVVGGALFLAVAGVVARKPPPGDAVEWGPRPLAIGLPVDGRRIEDLLRRSTTRTARVLWEDLSRRPDLGWTAQLPRRLGRPFVGGTDPDGTFEYAACALRDGNLTGRRLQAWTDLELDAYCRRYNVGWIVCATDAAGDRFARWPPAVPVPTPDGAGGWRVFKVRRPHTYVLKGHAARFDAGERRVTFTDVTPENGEVVISLHFLPGIRARPTWVRVDRDLDPYDPIPFVRLCMPAAAGRVTLTWDEN